MTLPLGARPEPFLVALVVYFAIANLLNLAYRLDEPEFDPAPKHPNAAVGADREGTEASTSTTEENL